MKKLLPIAILLLVGAGLAVWAWRRGHRTGDANEIVLHGNVDVRQVSLAFEGSGRLVELRAEEGDRVKAGDVLAVLDTKTLELQARQIEADAEVRRQTLLRLRNGSRPDEIARARSQLKGAEADAQRAERDLASAEKLRASGSLSEQEDEHAESAAEVASTKADDLRAALHLAMLGSRKEDVAGAAAQLEEAEAQLALLRHQIDLGQLHAPGDAVVRSRLLEPGDMVTPQRAVFALAVTQPKWIRVFVSEPDLGKIKPGMPARVLTDSQPNQPIAGRVGFISSVAEFTPKSVQTEELRTSLVYEVRVVVEDTAEVLRLGQPVTVHLPLAGP
ncbi:MAG TPA: HlyD family efflux transporter periplasmic adaptor subunit [Polyangiaceae bacterium]|jgi:HlyD family secretion protein